MLPTLDSLPASAAHLDHLVCIAFNGDDAESFLQGQFSNDINLLVPGTQQLNSYCNPKGRALCVFRLLREEDRWLMVLPRELADSITRRLTLYRMRARVGIEQPDDLQVIGVINPQEREQTVIESGRSWPIDASRTLVISHNQSVENDSTAWQLGDILSGVPQVYEATSEQLIPQHINLDLAGGVSFSKGCYPGQEIVARLHYLGKLKQRMIAVRIDAGGNYPPGTEVFTDKRGDQKAGLVVDSVNYKEASYLLVSIPADVIEDGRVSIGSPTGSGVTRLPLPYEITLQREDAAQ